MLYVAVQLKRLCSLIRKPGSVWKDMVAAMKKATGRPGRNFTRSNISGLLFSRAGIEFSSQSQLFY